MPRTSLSLTATARECQACGGPKTHWLYNRQEGWRMDLKQALPKFQSKHLPASGPLETPSVASCEGQGRWEQGHTVRPTGLCLALGEDPDPSNSGMDTNCSMVYWTRRALFDRASVTTVSFTEQSRTRVKGLIDKKDKSFP